MSLTDSADAKQNRTMLRHWPQFVPNMSTDIRRHEALHHHQLNIHKTTKSIRVSKLVSYAQSTGAVISGRGVSGTGRWGEGDMEVVSK